MRDPNGQSKGSGFVAFSSPDEASRAVCKCDHDITAEKKKQHDNYVFAKQFVLIYKYVTFF
jgi:hypothetical protein